MKLNIVRSGKIRVFSSVPEQLLIILILRVLEVQVVVECLQLDLYLFFECAVGVVKVFVEMMLSGSASDVPLTPEICVIILGDRVRIICELHVLITTVDHRIKLKRLSELRNELGRWDFSNRWIGWIFETFARVDEDDFLPLFVS